MWHNHRVGEGSVTVITWLLKNIRKIGFFGVEVEFRRPKDTVPSKPEPIDARVQERAKQPLPYPSGKLRVSGRVKLCPIPTQSDRLEIRINRNEYPDVDKLPHRGVDGYGTRNIFLWIGGKNYRAGLRNRSHDDILICPDLEDLEGNPIRLADVLNDAGFMAKQDVEFELSVVSASGLGE
jgi:hypothetical protein